MAATTTTPTSYGVVVGVVSEDTNGIWLLFSDNDPRLFELKADQCTDQLSIGDIVIARATDDDSTRISKGWPFPEAVWAHNGRVVVRTIVSYDKQITIDGGRWKETATNSAFVILVSRDIGKVSAPVDWYNSEFHESGESHVLAYTEFRVRPLTSSNTGAIVDYYWTIIADRISLPAIPARTEDPEKFLEAAEVRKVPAVTIHRQGNAMLVWSYALGDRLGIILADEDSVPGVWLSASMLRSSSRDLASHGCAWTVVQHAPATPYSQPEIKLVDGTIQMTLQLERTTLDPSNPWSAVRLWHDHWGLPIGCTDESWIRNEPSNQFRALVEIAVSNQRERERRATIRAIGPAVVPRLAKKSATDGPALSTLENLAAIKNALLDEERAIVQEDNNNYIGQNNNNNKDDPYAEWYSGGGGLEYREPREPRRKPNWSGIPKKEMKSPAPTRPSSPSKQRTGGPNWKQWDGKAKQREEEDERIRKAQAALENPDQWPRSDYRERRTYKSGMYKGKGTYGGLARAEDRYLREVGRGGETGAATEGYGASADTRTLEQNKLGMRAAGGADRSVLRSTPTPPPNATDEANAARTEEEPRMGGDVTPDFGDPQRKEGDIIEAIPIRAEEDRETELKWRAEMEKEGWQWPPERKIRKIPDGEDGWGFPLEEPAEPRPEQKPPMPIQELLSKPGFFNQARRLKRNRAVITQVRYDVDWKKADAIQLYVLDGEPTIIVHDIGNLKKSYIAETPDFTTVGNIVELNVGRSVTGYYVHDEMWKFVSKIKLPWRVGVYEPGRVKRLELIVNARCLCQDAQDRYNNCHRYNTKFKGFTVLMHDQLHNVAYFGTEIDPSERWTYMYQMLVVPEECLNQHVFWKATKIFWRIKIRLLESEFEPTVREVHRPATGPAKRYPPVHVKLKPSIIDRPEPARSDFSKRTGLLKTNAPKVIPRETRIEELLTLYGKMMENEHLMDTLLARTGTDYRKKFADAIEVAQTSIPHQRSMKRELQVNADFLISIQENAFSESIFKECGEKKLWKQLIHTSDQIKAFRSTINNR